MVAFCQVCFLFGLFVLVFFVLLFDIFLAWVARVVLPFVVMSRASAWFVALMAIVHSAHSYVASVIVAVFAGVVIQLFPKGWRFSLLALWL